jgi:hypothetical protein
MRRFTGRRLLTAIAISAISLFGLTAISAHAGADPPPLLTCDDVSGLCPPTSAFAALIPHYVWENCDCTAGSAVEFTGTVLPSSFGKSQSTCYGSDPDVNSDYQDYTLCSVPSQNGTTGFPNSTDAWFSANQVSVSGCELKIASSWTSSIKDCNDYWGYVVGIDGGPDHAANGCWVSGSIYQSGSNWAWQTGSSEEFAFRAKWTGTANINNLDSTLQAASYPTWPPEVDVAETDYTGSGTGPSNGFDTNVHCPATGGTNTDGNTFDGSPVGSPISVDMTSWHTYEFDVSPTAITIYVDGSLQWTLDESDSWCTATYAGSSGDGGASGDWIPSVGNTLGIFMEAVMQGGGSTQTTDNQTMLISWVAEQ